MKNFKLLDTYQTEFEAQLVRTKLEREGIEAMLEAQDRSNVIPSLDYSNGFNVYVEPEDLERALQIIHNTEDDLTDDMEISDTEE
jgi:ribonucleotide reductase beta subunit family protein with ferritin-like domain